MLLKCGNSKISKDCLIFNLPTSVCITGDCPRCYARKSEVRFKSVLEFRNRNYEASLKDDFVDRICGEIHRSKKILCRVHESGDFYSQEYVDKWTRIVYYNPQVKFYCYTKAFEYFDFSDFCDNMNIINSITRTGKYNYGSLGYCEALVKYSQYKICPCRKGIHIDCMSECQLCLTEKLVCFVEH